MVYFRYNRQGKFPENIFWRFEMKKAFFVLVIAVLAIASVSAQNWGTPQTISVTGALQLQNGGIVLVSGNNVYFVPALQQYVGFVEGLREGAQCQVDGYASGNFIQATRFAVNGKSYDLGVNYPQGGYGYGMGFHHGGGYGSYGMGYHHGGGWGHRGRGW
jgi:hypothetical protein